MDISLTQLAIDLISALGYAGLLLGLILDSAGPPIPSEILIPLATVLVMQGRFELWMVFVIATIGQVLGAVLSYIIGRYAGEPFLERYGKYLLVTKGDLTRARWVFDRYGWWMILFGRCVPGIRGVIGYPAGVSEMRLGVYVLFTILGSALWSGLMIYVGYFVGNNLDLMDKVAQQFSIVGVLVLAGFLAWHFRGLWWKQGRH